MATAKICFSTQHDQAAIAFEGRPGDATPAGAINAALEVLYRTPNLGPYLFCVYEGNRETGLLLSENFEPDPDNPQPEIRAVYYQILDANDPPPTGQYAPFEVEI